jgi:predicted nucleic acid-binding protein
VIVVDSSVWIDHFRSSGNENDRRLTRDLTDGKPVGLTDVIYMELLQGVRAGAELAQLRLRLAQTTILELRGLEDFEVAADLYSKVRARGHTIRRRTECMIAAVCIRKTVPLLHDDVDFDRIADVSDLQVA